MIKKNLAILSSIAIAMASTVSVISYAEETMPTEVISLRSACEKDFDNGDGTYTKFIDSAPLHYFDEEKWNEIDNTLIQDESGNFVNKSNSMKISLNPSAYVKSTESTGEEDTVSVSYEGYEVSWSFVNEAFTEKSAKESQEKAAKLIINDVEHRTINMKNEKLSNYLTDVVSKIDTSATYVDLLPNTDVKIDLSSASLTETFILNSKETVPEKISYSINVKELTPSIDEDKSIHFINNEGKEIFTFPAAFMYDSSKKCDYNYDVEVELYEKDKNSYILSYIPNAKWLNSDERVFPVMIDPDIRVATINSGMDCKYIYNNSANSIFPYQYMRVGKSYDNEYQSIVKINNMFANIPQTISRIYNANFSFYAPPNSLSSIFSLDVEAINSYVSNPCWNTIANNSYVDIQTLFISPSSTYRTYVVDITNCTQYWLNNYYTGLSDIGIENNGLRFKSNSNDQLYFPCNTTDSYRACFSMIFSLNDPFTLDYLPTRYNDDTTLGVSNFQNRMNCYAYALQMYYSGNLNADEFQKLNPGELGLHYNGTNYTKANLETDYINKNSLSSFLAFTEQQMFNDSEDMGTNLTKISLSNTNKFVLPSAQNYNDSSQRIIAMTGGNRTVSSPSGTSMTPAIKYDFHFYVRHGNGTCNTHGGTCSMWSHKPSNRNITNQIGSTTLCDDNIAQIGKTFQIFEITSGITTSYSEPLQFYIINQDADLYNSHYTYVGTPAHITYTN